MKFGLEDASTAFASPSTPCVIQYSHALLGRGGGFGLLTTYQPVMQRSTQLCKSNIPRFVCRTIFSQKM